MRIWNSFPMLRVILPFLIGVVSTSFLVEFLEWTDQLTVHVFSVLGFLLLLGLILGIRTRNQLHFGLITWVLMLVLGTALTLSVSDQVFPDGLCDSSNAEMGSYVIRIVDEPQVKENSVKVLAEVTDVSMEVYGKVLLYFRPDSLSRSLKYGELLVVSTKLSPVENLGNPNEFNYKRYLRFNGIAYRGYVGEGRCKLLSEGSGGVWGALYAIRSNLINKLVEARLSDNELAVASALILGYRADLDKELMTAYAGAGATHVLAVSGLHVGIVYVILNTLLKFMDRKKRGKVLKTILLIVLLFGYAGLTGLSASVFRAATMFSFVAIGKAIDRDTNIFNTLAASAFCLIAIQPMIIMQVGFQLSYAAVIGIVLIQPRMFNLLVFNNRLLDWAWSITCVSIAAQIATAPLGLLYFHQFPNLFLVSNLLVIPAAAAILYLGFSLFLFSFWEPTLLFFGFLLNRLISILNTAVMWIEQVPYSVLSGIDIATIETLMIYAMISGVLLFIIQKLRLAIYTSLALGVVFMILQIVEVQEQRHQQFAAIYNVRGETAMALVSGTKVTFLSSRKFYENDQAMLFHVRHHWWNRGIIKENFVELNDSVFNRVLEWQGKRFALINLKDNYKTQSTITDKLLDYAIIDKAGWNEVDKLADLNTSKLYTSNSFGLRTVDKIKEVLKEKTLIQIGSGAVLIE